MSGTGILVFGLIAAGCGVAGCFLAYILWMWIYRVRDIHFTTRDDLRDALNERRRMTRAEEGP